MCTYGIGLPYDHPIWQNLPPCTCGTRYTIEPRWDNPIRTREPFWWQKPVDIGTRRYEYTADTSVRVTIP